MKKSLAEHNYIVENLDNSASRAPIRLNYDIECPYCGNELYISDSVIFDPETEMQSRIGVCEKCDRDLFIKC